MCSAFTASAAIEFYLNTSCGINRRVSPIYLMLSYFSTIFENKSINEMQNWGVAGGSDSMMETILRDGIAYEDHVMWSDENNFGACKKFLTCA